MEKCTVKRIPADSDTGDKEEKVFKEEEIEALPEEVAEPVKEKLVRRIGAPLVTSDTDASTLLAPQNEIVVAAAFLLALVLICLVRGRGKNEAKTQ